MKLQESIKKILNENKIFEKDYNQIENFINRRMESGEWWFDDSGVTLTLYNKDTPDLLDNPYSQIILEVEDDVLWVSKGLIDDLKNITGEPWSYNKYLIESYMERNFVVNIEYIQIL
jgi:hypothetical protein